MAAGVVRRPFGLRGEVYVHPDPDVADPFPVGQSYRAVGEGDAQPGEDSAPMLTVVSSAVHKGLQIVRFDGVDDREQATALRDLVLWRAAAATDLDDDAFWADELIGRAVVDADGDPVGTLTGLRDGPAHDYLVVTDARGREVLVPAVSDLVDVQADRVVLTPLSGLFDLDDGAPDAPGPPGEAGTARGAP